MKYKIRSNIISTFLFLFLLIFSGNNLAQQKAKSGNSKTVNVKSVEALESLPQNPQNIFRSYNIDRRIRKKADAGTVYEREILDYEDDYSPGIVRTQNYFRISKDDYLWNGKHWESDRFPLHVYLKKSDSKNFKNKFSDYIKYALEIWKKADERITFEIVDNENDADISIGFVENLMKKMRNDYIGFTDYKHNRNKELRYVTIDVSILKYKNEKLTDGEIKGVLIHELGHALGLGHSENILDLMYPYIPPEFSPELNYNELTTGDIEAIRSAIDLGY